MQQESVADALERGGIADITTIGRRSGLPRRIEIFFHNIDGEMVLTGRPGGKRDWEANISANPDFTLHLTNGPVVDVPVVGFVETDPVERGKLIRRALVEGWDMPPEKADHALQRWVEDSPLVRFRPA